MKYLLFSCMMIQGFNAFSHCPNTLEVQGERYCYTLDWLKGEKRKGGNFVEVEQLSPYLNEMNELPQKRVFSKLNFKMWMDGDKSHVFATPEGFSVQPYMLMAVDHPSHGLSYEVDFIEEEQVLQISKMPFRNMRGCWSLVWETKEGKLISLANKFVYSNKNDQENAERNMFCRGEVEPNPPGGDHGGHGGHH